MTGTRQLFAIHLQRDDIQIFCKTSPKLRIYPWPGSDFHFDLDSPEIAAIVAWMDEKDPESCKPVTILLEDGMIVTEDDAGEPKPFKKLKAVYDPISTSVIRPRFDSHEWVSKEVMAKRLTKGIAVLFKQLKLSYPHFKDVDVGMGKRVH